MSTHSESGLAEPGARSINGAAIVDRNLPVFRHDRSGGITGLTFVVADQRRDGGIRKASLIGTPFDSDPPAGRPDG